MTEEQFRGESLPDASDEGLASPRAGRRPEEPPPSEINEELLEVAQEPEGLTEEESATFQNLLVVGKLQRTCEVAGHPLLIETLTVDEELQLALMCKPYMNSDGYTRAYRAAVVALSVREIDGRPIYTPLSARESDEEIARKKFAKIREYYPVIADMMYRECNELEKELTPLAEKLAKKM